jgi:hypothetical protein
LAEKAARALWREIKSFPEAAIEAEKAQRALEAALETTGRVIPGLADDFAKFALEIQRETVYDDEAAKGAQTLLLQLTNLDSQGMQRAIKGAAGLATVMRTDLQSAASLIAKAMEGNFGALARYGIKVRETGTLEERRAELLDKLNVMYGRATAETGTFSGKLDRLKNTYDEVKEAAGAFILKQQGVIEILDATGNFILEYINKDDMLREASDRSAAAQQQLMEKLAWANAEAGLGHSNWLRLTEAYHGNWIEMSRAIRTGQEGVDIQAALTRVSREWLIEREREIKAAAEAERGMDRYNDRLKETIKLMPTPLPTGREFARVLEWIGTSIGTTALPALRNLTVGMIMFGFTFPPVYAKLAEIYNKQEETARRTLGNFQSVASGFAGLFSGLAALSDANLARQMQNFDLEYAARKAAIDQMGLSEVERYAMLGKLDAEFEAKRKAARRDAGEKSKAWSLWEATINTAQAITSALATKPFFPVGLVMAAFAAAQGAMQIAAIRAQPVPLAKGGILARRTFAGDYEAGEAGPEAIIPISERARRRAQAALWGGEGAGRPIVLNVPIYVGARKIQEQVIEIVENASETGRLRIRSRAVN